MDFVGVQKDRYFLFVSEFFSAGVAFIVVTVATVVVVVLMSGKKTFYCFLT